MGLTELKFGLTSCKYCASKLTIASQNYLPNMAFLKVLLEVCEMQVINVPETKQFATKKKSRKSLTVSPCVARFHCLSDSRTVASSFLTVLQILSRFFS